MGHILFSEDWNGKLKNPVAFTTIRKSNVYYTIDQIYDIKLKGQIIGRAQLVDKKRVKIEDLSVWVTLLDSGYDKINFTNLMIKFYGKQYVDKDYFDFMLFTWVK